MPQPDGQQFLAAVRRHCEHVLRVGRGRWQRRHAAAFVDALDVDSDAPATWRHAEDGRILVPSNFANQQDWLRTLTGLSALTGEQHYTEAAEAAVAHAFAELQEASGLLRWGGHCGCDLLTGETFGLENLHELKCHYPFYEELWRVNAPATRRFIEGFWNAHVLDWRTLDLNRHGHFGGNAGQTAPWTHSLELEPVFFVGHGLSFINTGSDLFFAAGNLSALIGEAAPLAWAERLARRYAEETRHPATGLGGYQFSRIEDDRAREQLGPEFGDRACEYSVLDRTRATRKFAIVGLCQLALADKLGAKGEAFRRWAVEDLRAFARSAFDPATCRFHAVLRDGTRLTPADVKRPGYYRADTFAPYRAEPVFFWAYSKAFRTSGDSTIGETAAAIGRGLGLGNLMSAHLDTPFGAGDPWTLLALLEWFELTRREEFLRAAAAVGDHVLRDRTVGNYFVEDSQQRFARVGRPEPLALLHLVAALQGRDGGGIPTQLPGHAYFTAPAWGNPRTSDYIEWFPLRRGAPGENPPAT